MKPLASNGYSNRSSNSGFIALKERVEHLGFRSFQTLVLLWLGARGYRDICSLGRHHRRGRRQISGADWVAKLPGSSEVSVAIQLRHRGTPTPRLSVDELRGFMLRSDIPVGLIVTSSQFSKPAVSAASEFPGRPIRLVGSHELTQSLMALGLGLKLDRDGLVINEGFFHSLGSLGSAALLRPDSPPVVPAVQRPAVDTGFGQVEPPQESLVRIALIIGTVLLIWALLYWWSRLGR
ncbi:MAG: restriction endonuclease [Fimbriimonadaceae bacterium]|nr:restriction endonuclease [Fimbriimonadaceae bacterium]